MIEFRIGDRVYTINQGTISPYEKIIVERSRSAPVSEASNPNPDKEMVEHLFSIYRDSYGLECEILDERPQKRAITPYKEGVIY